MSWSALKEKLPDAVKDKSLELRQLFARTANKILEDTGNETKAIQAGIHAVVTEEHKKKKLAKASLEEQKRKKAEEEVNYKPPSHLTALLEAANLKKQALLEQEELERKKLQELKDSILQEVQSDTDNAIVDIKVLGEDVLLVQKNGKTLRRKLADYVVNQSVVVTGGSEGQAQGETGPAGPQGLKGDKGDAVIYSWASAEFPVPSDFPDELALLYRKSDGSLFSLANTPDGLFVARVLNEWQLDYKYQGRDEKNQPNGYLGLNSVGGADAVAFGAIEAAGTGGYYVNGVRVIGSRQAAIAAATRSISTNSINGTWTMTEGDVLVDCRDAINEHKTAINAIISVLKTHGLIA